MFRGFNLELEKAKVDILFKVFDESDDLIKIASNDSQLIKGSIRDSLTKYIEEGGELNGKRIRENWFPQVEADIFISHSHTDLEKVQLIAGLLKVAFGLRCFIDSDVWGYADSLLYDIDMKYCKNPSGDTFSYEKRNQSTSHVHMLLSTALTMMIDRTECVLFVNTPNSVSPLDGTDVTYSPWIYSEIVATQLVRKKTPLRLKTVKLSKKVEPYAMNEGVKIAHELDLDHLTDISTESFFEWIVKCSDDDVKNPESALDKLYKMNPRN